MTTGKPIPGTAGAVNKATALNGVFHRTLLMERPQYETAAGIFSPLDKPGCDRAAAGDAAKISIK
jgi:hypothetical protein